MKGPAVLWRNQKAMGKLLFFRVSMGMAVVFCAALIFIPSWFLMPEIREAGTIPLHYNVLFGVDWYGPWWFAFTLPVLGVLVLITNTIVAAAAWSRHRLLSHMLWGTSAFVTLFFLIGIIFVTLLNLTYI